MNCARFEELLFESLDARLGATDTERLRAHARSCTRCRELAALMADVDDTSSMDVPDDLVTGVLARTTGSSCERAQLLLAEGADGPLGADGGLLSIHLGACNKCARLARALVQMRSELPTLAELEPDDRFVADVMAATIGVAEPRSAPLHLRVREMWERAVQRPRFAFEAAYAGVLVAFLIFGLPSQSIVELPARALGDIRQESINVQRVVSSSMGEVFEVSRSAWSDSMQRAAVYFDESEAGARASSRVERDLRTWAGAARDLAIRVWDGVVAPFAANLRALWRDPTTIDAATVPNELQDTRP